MDSPKEPKTHLDGWDIEMIICELEDWREFLSWEAFADRISEFYSHLGILRKTSETRALEGDNRRSEILRRARGYIQAAEELDAISLIGWPIAILARRRKIFETGSTTRRAPVASASGTSAP